MLGDLQCEVIKAQVVKIEIIKVNKFKKTFKTFRRGQGLYNAIKSLFKRDYVIKHAVRGIDLSIKQGEILGFIGPNGAGKSTTIKALCGILYPSEGELLCNGLNPWNDRIEYVKNIGVIFGQKTQLIIDLPAIDIFHLHKEYYEVSDKVFNKNVKQMIKLLDIAEVVKRPVRQLSLGERMKCELAVALLHDPKIVFLDEPTIGLDLVSKERIRDFIKKVNREKGTTFIVTTHDMGDIEDLCERIVLINHGTIIYDGALDKVKELLNIRLIKVKLLNKRKSLKLKGCNILKNLEYEFDLEVNLTKRKIQSVVKELIDNYNIVDITITNPPIEDIIKIIYKKKKKFEF